MVCLPFCKAGHHRQIDEKMMPSLESSSNTHKEAKISSNDDSTVLMKTKQTDQRLRENSKGGHRKLLKNLEETPR